jgi:hypothetical protein
MEFKNVVNKENLPLLPLAARGIARGLWETSSPAEKAWGALIAEVLAYEVLCPKGETLSEGVDRALETHPFITTLAIGYTALHLMNLLPPEIDLFHRLTER